MKALPAAASLLLVSFMLPSAARPADLVEDAAQDPGAPPGGQAQEAAPPASPAPDETPPAPPADVPAPPAQQQAAPAAPSATGQWVYTNQYGWVWAPYGDQYSYVPPDGYGEPYLYVYYPSYGWTWLSAPWVWGIGPWPYFGVFGPVRFGWFVHGWWHTPWRWHFRPAPFRAGFPGHGFAPFRHGAPSRFDRGGVRTAPSHGFAGGGARFGGGAHFGGGRGGFHGGHR
ncbi:MAG TPA: hypothetical protein VF832_12160 [Longimicrobiales bacterium]